MDIYPTLLHLLGCDKYYWKGVGVNLLEQDTLVNRPITLMRHRFCQIK